MKFSGRQDVYLEIAQRYEHYIYNGLYPVGEKLPSVRQVASELGVNPNTVAKAYAVLEEKGLVRALPKKGAFVIYGEESEEEAPQQTTDLRPLLREMKKHGVRYEDLILQAKEVFEQDDSDS